MNENPSRMTHPEELLAGYVDGSASLDERASVDAHLPFCPRCTNEVRLARAGRAALVALPELDSPGLAGTILSAARAPAGVSDIDDLMAAALASERSPAASTFGAAPSDGAPPEDRVVVPLSEARSRRGVGRIVTAIAGVAVAAAFVAVALFLPHHAAQQTDAAPSGRAGVKIAKASSPPISSEGHVSTNFTAKSLDAFARSLAAADRTPNESISASPTSTRPPVPAFDPLVVQCAEQGAGVTPNAEVQYFATGHFEGAPAYVGVFRLPGPPKPYLVVVAVTPKGCQPLHYARQTI